MSGITLTGTYVDLRPLTVADATMTHGWRQGARAKHLNRGAATVEQQAAWIASRPTDELNFVIQLKNARPVGMLGLSAVDMTHRHAEPGRFMIGDEAAVRGIPAAVEAMKLLYEHVFETMGLVRVYGTIAANNRRMVTWQKFIGMREEGRMRRHLFLDGEYQDALVFGLLADEYRMEARARMNTLIRMADASIDQKKEACS